VKPKLKVWVVFGERVKFGDGRADLLQLIDELGSLKKAVARFGMSYRTHGAISTSSKRPPGSDFLSAGRADRGPACG
jgi:molybdate transport system regulatory protein